MRRIILTWLLCLPLLACGERSLGKTKEPHVIFIDVDDHGLSALWDSNSPNLQRAARQGVFGFSRVDIPTHSNQSNMTLLAGAWPEVTDVPHNAWLDRKHGFVQPFKFGPLSVGSYIFYEQNPLVGRIESLYTAARAAGMESAYFGLLPPFERGADEVHLTIFGASLLGIVTIDEETANYILDMIHYTADIRATMHFDGPPMSGEALNKFTIRDLAERWRAFAKGGKPVPQMTFVWDFIALDGNPTSSEGASGPEVKKIIEDIDAGLGELLAAVREAGYEDSTSYVLTLDHGKVDTHNQVVLAKQFKDLVTAQGAAHGVGPMDYKILDEDGDAHIYAVTEGAGTAAGVARQTALAHGLVELVQSGAIMGLDTSRTITWDGYLGTRRFYDVHSSGPNNPDIVVFPQPDWTFNDVAANDTPGPIGRELPYGRHGGFTTEELYVPAIFWGPAFKKGVVLPTPIDHPDITSTVAAALGIKQPTTAQGGAIAAALASDKQAIETMAFPADPHTLRDTVLANAGFGGVTPALAGAAAQGAVLIDVSGLYEDGFTPGARVTELAKRGVRFVAMHTRFRDWPVTEYQMLTGTYPVRLPWVPFAENDPAQEAPPGFGEFAMPPAKNYISDTLGFAAWHSGVERFEDQTVFAAARTLGFTTAALGTLDFHTAHVNLADIDVTGMPLDIFVKANPKSFVLYAVDGGADPTKAADDALTVVEQALDGAGGASKYLIVLTSRGGAPIDSPTTDAHGPGSARHVPLILAGPNLRTGALLGGRVSPADLAPTILFALGATPRAPDLAYGVTLDGGMSPSGTPLPLPTGNLEGHVLVPAFTR